MISTRTNPALQRVQKMSEGAVPTEAATYGGIAKKSLYFIALTFFSAWLSFAGSVSLIEQGNTELMVGLLIGCSVLTLITGLIAVLNVSATKIAGSIYATAQGFVMGFTALLCHSMGYGGEVFSALVATIGVFGVMLALYASGVIRVGSGFKRFMMSALISVLFANLTMLIVSLFSRNMFELFYGNGIISIGISVIMVFLASFMILIDLNRMTEIVERGLDKKYEWIASFGLLVTLIWLYMEFLRLFLKLASRRR